MDREIWRTLRTSVKRICRSYKTGRRKPQFSHAHILLMYFWCVWQNRCLNWACDPTHYGGLFRPRELPSISQFRRRVADDVFQSLLQLIHQDLAREGVSCPVKYLDAKPLLVSPVSKDVDARNGHITGGFAKGYKLHAMIGENRRIIIWSVMPLNVAEQSIALELSMLLKPAAAPGLILADSNYDSAPLHKSLALSDHLLLTPLKAQQRVKDGVHHPVTLRQMGPQRREALEVWKKHPDLAKYMLKGRNNIEGVFSVMSLALNAGSPPPWVRRLSRVRRWAGAMIILHNARIRVQEIAKMEMEQPHRN
jgi:Transposase DDE domain